MLEFSSYIIEVCKQERNSINPIVNQVSSKSHDNLLNYEEKSYKCLNFQDILFKLGS